MEHLHTEAIGLLGAGGQAREAESYLIGAKVSFYAVDPQYIKDEQYIDVTSPNEHERSTPVVAAVGAPAIRRNIVDAWPGSHFFTIVAEGAHVNKGTTIGEGSIIAPGVIITTNVMIGTHAIINVGATISHDCKLGNYVTIAPGAHVAGNVALGDGVFVGIGATISNNVKIADGCIIGAGAVVLNDIEEENSVVVGVPARTIRINEGWLREI